MGAVAAIDRIANRCVALGNLHHLLGLMGIMAAGAGNCRVGKVLAGGAQLGKGGRSGGIYGEALAGIVADGTLHHMLSLGDGLTVWPHLLDINPTSCSQTGLACARIPLEEEFVRAERGACSVGIGMGGLVEVGEEWGMALGLAALLCLGNRKWNRP